MDGRRRDTPKPSLPILFAMKKPLLTLFVLLLVSINAIAAGSWHSGKVDASAAGSRDYKVWLPEGYDSNKPLPMIVALHGCMQNAEAFSTQTGLNALADTKKFIVLYPLQSSLANGLSCWNWMLDSNQSKMGGEPEIIAKITEQVVGKYAVDKSRVYIAGLSAGGGMASNMMACYPEIYAAGSVHGGVMFRAADNPGVGMAAMFDASKANSPEVTGRAAWECSGKFRKPVPVMIWHGTSDNIVVPGHVDLMVRQFVKMNDLADDGQENDSISSKNPEKKTVKTDKKRSYVRETYRGFNQDLIVKCMVEGMDHAWSGGSSQIPYSDPSGPDATQIMVEWFLTKKR